MLLGIILGIILCQLDIRTGYHITTKATDLLWDKFQEFYKKGKRRRRK